MGHPTYDLIIFIITLSGIFQHPMSRGDIINPMIKGQYLISLFKVDLCICFVLPCNFPRYIGRYLWQASLFPVADWDRRPSESYQN